MRRIFSATVALILMAPCASQAADLLDKAMARAGGAARLARVNELRWTGTAKIFAGARIIEIGVSTMVHPGKDARSDTWLLSDGPAKTRSLIVEGSQGWSEMNGVRTPLPPAQAANEAQQYALYALMLLTPLRDGRGSFAIDGVKPEIAVTYPGAPPTRLTFDADGRLTGAHNSVPAPDGNGPPVVQDFHFDGDIVSHGVHWPRRLTIDQDGKPFFALTLDHFETRMR